MLRIVPVVRSSDMIYSLSRNPLIARLSPRVCPSVPAWLSNTWVQFVASVGKKMKISAWEARVGPQGWKVGEAKAGAWYAEHRAGGQ